MGARLAAAKNKVKAKAESKVAEAGKPKKKANPKGAVPGRTRKPYDESKHVRDTGGRYGDKPGAGDDAPKKGRAKFGRLDPKVARAHTQGKVVGAREHAYATARERDIAKALGGEHIGDHTPVDVIVRTKAVEHGIEVKTLMKGKKQSITMHADALARKVDYHAAGGRVVHTVALDHRAKYRGGAFKSDFSGHEIYYKRGAAAHKLTDMHKVKDMAELKRLVAMKDADLPAAARGSLPSGDALAKLRADAERDSQSRKARDKRRKTAIRDAKREAQGGS